MSRRRAHEDDDSDSDDGKWNHYHSQLIHAKLRIGVTFAELDFSCVSQRLIFT